MKRILLYLIWFGVLLDSCEDVYNPELKDVPAAIVADARITAGKTGNVVYLYNTLGFNDKIESYKPVTSASVSIFDDKGVETKLTESKKGTFPADVALKNERKYKLRIKAGSDTFESDFQGVQQTPAIDSIYGAEIEKIIDQGGVNNVNDFEKSIGVQVYVDMKKMGSLSHYRFYARKILQFSYEIIVMTSGEPVPHVMYAWKTVYPQGTFNIAGPPEYSSMADIFKHPVEFFQKEPYGYLEPNQWPRGWIYIIQQYGISESTYNYYQSLNKQLEANGKLFDPLFVQPKGNIRCTNNPDKLILGNFEISSYKEYWYFVNYSSSFKSFVIRPIRQSYNIPEEGKQLDVPPDFWQN